MTRKEIILYNDFFTLEYYYSNDADYEYFHDIICVCDLHYRKIIKELDEYELELELRMGFSSIKPINEL